MIIIILRIVVEVVEIVFPLTRHVRELLDLQWQIDFRAVSVQLAALQFAFTVDHMVQTKVVDHGVALWSDESAI